ncbi:MAG: hypothetical protein AAB892_00710 [Patescibacteria group bacterium]
MSRLIPVIGILLAIGLFFGYINPTLTGPIAVAKQQIQDYDSALAAADRFRQKEAQLSQERSNIPPESLARLEAFLPDGVDNVQLILDLDALATRSGIQLGNFDTTEVAVDAANDAADGVITPSDHPVDSIELTMSGKGTYAAFRTFLDNVEVSLRPLDLIALDVQTTETGVYTYNMTFRLYWLR